MKMIAVFACILLAAMIFGPITVNARFIASNMNTLQFRCTILSTQDALFTALLTPDNVGGVDSMQWPLTRAEYTTAITFTNITVEPLSESGEFEIALNNNWTDGVHNPGVVRDAMNFTDFRNAMNCLVDQQATITGPILGGFATQSFTQIPTPLMQAYVNPAVSGANYPWAFNVTHALSILYNGGWYNHATYPTFASLITAYGGGTGSLLTAGGTASGVVYSGNDPNGQWGGGDPNGAVNAGIANTPLAPLQGYVRSNDARLNLGQNFEAELQAIGCPYTEHLEPTLTALRPYVLAAQTYDFATLAYSFGAPPNLYHQFGAVPPNWWYSELTPAGIYANGPNPYLVDDSNMTFYATRAFTDSTPAAFAADVNTVQQILVMESELIAGYCPAAYCAYKAGLLGTFDILGQGTEANGAMAEDWVTLNARKATTINWPNFTNVPESNILYLGQLYPPDMINPIFQGTVFDFQISDEIFTYPMGCNPYTIATGSAITGVPAGGDLPWMAYAWTEATVPNPTGHDLSGDGSLQPTWTNVTLWFRNDITWHDGTPFTVADINYTIYINSVYRDAYDNSAMIWATNTTAPGPGLEPSFAPYFTQDPSATDPSGLYACSILVSSASWLNLYLPLYEIVPQHLYKYIVPNNLTAAEIGISTDGLHGLWPGQAAVAGNLLAGAPWTLLDLTNKPETTLVGTGPFDYVASSITNPWIDGGSTTLDAYPAFFMQIAAGAMALKYTWLNTAPASQPSGGYFKVGLNDLVLLANAYGTTGTPPSTVSISGVPGASHTWNPAADVAAPAGTVDLSDLVTLALHYGWYFGNYSYNAPYPPSELANGGP